MGEVALSVPLWQVGLYVFLISIFMLFGRLRLCLLVSYCFSFFWVFISNKNILITERSQNIYVLAFFISGILVIAFSIWSFFVDTK